MRVYKVEAEGDTMYFQANDISEAKQDFVNLVGVVPDYLLTWNEIKKLPDGQEFAN